MAVLHSAKYGKDKVRVFRVVRHKDGKQDVAEYVVKALLEGEIEKSYTESDNSSIVATDSIKNTIYLFAKQSPHVLQPESFALELACHFVKTYAHIHKAHVEIIKLKWSRIMVDGKPHKHSFQRDGDEKRFTSVTVTDAKGKANLSGTVQSGIQGLLVLKTTESSFENYVFDKYTTLPPVSDRLFSTSVDCQYDINLPASVALSADTIPRLGIDFEAIFAKVQAATLEVFATHKSASVQATLFQMCERILAENKHVGEVSYQLPNKHYFAVDMGYIGVKNLKPTDAEVFMAVDAPSGLIIATVRRDEKEKL